MYRYFVCINVFEDSSSVYIHYSLQYINTYKTIIYTKHLNIQNINTYKHTYITAYNTLIHIKNTAYKTFKTSKISIHTKALIHT